MSLEGVSEAGGGVLKQENNTKEQRAVVRDTNTRKRVSKSMDKEFVLAKAKRTNRKTDNISYISPKLRH